MKRPTFLEGVVFAIGVSVAGGVLFSVFGSLFAESAVLRLLIAGIGFAYVIYLLARSPERVGRITVTTLWLATAGAIWLLGVSLPLYLLLHVGLLWMIRSLYFYSSVLSSLADLGVNGLGVVAAIWAVVQTNSMFMSIWCFFLVQALFVFIPVVATGKSKHTNHDVAEDRFEQAHREAEAALRKFSSHPNH